LLDRFKDFLRSDLGLPPDGILFGAGLACFLVTCMVLRRPLSWPWALIPGICIAITLEALEIWDHYGPERLFETDAREVLAILWRHCRDVFVMNSGAAALVILANLYLRIDFGD
jgi:hypothetical protein